MRVEQLPPAATPKGALMRLKNLGYFEGVAGDAIDRGGESALRQFQKDHEIDESGKLDAATASELEKVHGN